MCHSMRLGARSALRKKNHQKIRMKMKKKMNEIDDDMMMRRMNEIKTVQTTAGCGYTPLFSQSSQRASSLSFPSVPEYE